MVDSHQYGSMAFLSYIIITWLIMYVVTAIYKLLMVFCSSRIMYILSHNNFPWMAMSPKNFRSGSNSKLV